MLTTFPLHFALLKYVSEILIGGEPTEIVANVITFEM